eukprot:7458733-Pyramimonas_sp.AAC.1
MLDLFRRQAPFRRSRTGLGFRVRHLEGCFGASFGPPGGLLGPLRPPGGLTGAYGGRLGLSLRVPSLWPALG